jgi:hypothetical protein
MTIPGPAGIQPGSRQGIVMEVAVAAGRLPINTVGTPGGMISSGNPGCGNGVGAGAGGWMGAWQCGMLCSTMSVMRAAGGLKAGLGAIGCRLARCGPSFGRAVPRLASSFPPYTGRHYHATFVSRPREK